PPYLAGIIMRCLEKNPERRYESFFEVLDDLVSAHFTPWGKKPTGRFSAVWFAKVSMVSLAVLLVVGTVPVVRHYLPIIRGTRIQLGTAGGQVPHKHRPVLPLKAIGDHPTLAEVGWRLNS